MYIFDIAVIFVLVPMGFEPDRVAAPGLRLAWNHTANVHLATISLSNEFKFRGITFL